MEKLPSKKRKAIELATVVREVLADQALFRAVLSKSSKQPIYAEFLSEENQNFANGIAVAMAIKALSGDVQAANYLMKAGGFEKIDIGIHSDFYNDNRLEIEVLQPNNNQNILAEATATAIAATTEKIVQNRNEEEVEEQDGEREVPRVTVKRSDAEQRLHQKAVE